MAVLLRKLFCFVFVSMGLLILKHYADFFLWKERFFKPVERIKDKIKVLQVESNCGIPHVCPENSFALYLSTGGPMNQKPLLCVGGRYILKPKVNHEGRGLNAAIINPNYFEVVSLKNFDTFVSNKTNAITKWLDEILDNDIVIMFTSDEASSNLGPKIKSLINELGSGMIQNLNFRSQWYMISQKGTQGFAKYEKMTFSKRRLWGEPIEFRGCVPRKVPKKSITVDEPLKQNKKKLEFCVGKEEKQYKGFCNEPRFEMIMPALQTNKSLVKDPVYHLPIFVFVSKNLEVFISCLDNLIHQPGVVVSLVTVLYEKEDSDVRSLARIYGMRLNQTKLGNNFLERLTIAREICKENFPQKEHLIVIDSEVIPSPDFLHFFVQTFPTLIEDQVSAISAWSPNCYDHDGGIHLAYRIEGVPKYAALIPVYPIEKNPCGEIYVPDVSRVQGPEVCHMPSLELDNLIERPQDLKKRRYYFKLVMLLQLSHVVDASELLDTCSHSALKKENNVVYMKAKSLPKVLKCLGVLKSQYGEYNGVIRLLELSKNDVKTSTQIGLAYVPARSVMYEQLPMPRLPKLRLEKAYTVDTIYTPIDGLKTTYNETFKLPVSDENMNFFISKLPQCNREYFKYGKQCRPIKFGETEYTAEYPMKPHPPISRGINVEKLTTFPMILLGRDEREKLPLTANYGKYLDIYVSTSRLAHRAFTLQEQKTIAMKNIVTAQETMGVPKARGFGCKFPEFAGQDLDNRNENMIDKTVFKTEAKPKFIFKKMPKVPNFGSESEAQAAYKRPEGLAKAHLFDRFIEYPEGIPAPAPRQNLCPPGMYTTEMYAINNHTSPQVVV